MNPTMNLVNKKLEDELKKIKRKTKEYDREMCKLLGVSKKKLKKMRRNKKMNPIKTRKIILHGHNSTKEQLQFEYKDQWHDIKDASEVPEKIKIIDAIDNKIEELEKPKKKARKK